MTLPPNQAASGVSEAGAPESSEYDAAILEVVARAIYDALEAGDVDPFLGEFRLHRPVTVDGRFDFLRVAQTLMKSLPLKLRTPPEAAHSFPK